MEVARGCFHAGSYIILFMPGRGGRAGEINFHMQNGRRAAVSGGMAARRYHPSVDRRVGEAWKFLAVGKFGRQELLACNYHLNCGMDSVCGLWAKFETSFSGVC